jgi:RNase P/RNase MRP subunit POP5
MSEIKDLTLDDIESLIEQKMLEFFGDPDSGLALRTEFREELKRRLKNQRRTITHQEVISKFG